VAIEDNLLTSPNRHEISAANDDASAEAAGNVIDCSEQPSVQTKMAELEASNHQLRVENLALRTRLERQKSNRSLQKSLIIAGMVSLWFFFILSVITKLIASSN